MHRRMVRSIRVCVAVAVMPVFCMAGVASADTNDCTRLDTVSAASVMGVPKARANPVQGQHSKQPPDNMDVLACGYAEVSPDPLAKTLSYLIYTPVPKDLESVFSS